MNFHCILFDWNSQSNVNGAYGHRYISWGRVFLAGVEYKINFRIKDGGRHWQVTLRTATPTRDSQWMIMYNARDLGLKSRGDDEVLRSCCAIIFATGGVPRPRWRHRTSPWVLQANRTSEGGTKKLKQKIRLRRHTLNVLLAVVETHCRELLELLSETLLWRLVLRQQQQSQYH